MFATDATASMITDAMTSTTNTATTYSRSQENENHHHVDDLFSMIENVCGTIQITSITNEQNPFVCAREGHVEDLKHILEAKGGGSGSGSAGNGQGTHVKCMDLNKRDIISGSGRTILQEAAAHGHIECINLILDYGKQQQQQQQLQGSGIGIGSTCSVVDVNAKSYLGHDTALHFAVRHNHRDIAFALLHHGSNPNQRNKYGKCPLHYVTKKSMASLLITFGASTAVKDDDDHTPLDVIVESLLKQGSEATQKEYEALVKYLDDANGRETQKEIRDEIQENRRQKKEIELLRQREEEAREGERQKDVMKDYLAWRMR